MSSTKQEPKSRQAWPRSVLLYSHSWLPGQVDGVAVRMMAHARAMVDQGIKVTVVTPDFVMNRKPDEPARVQVLPGTEHVTVPTGLQPVYRKNFCLEYSFKSFFALLAVLRRVKPDMVHAAQDASMQVIATACLYLNVPLVISMHTDVGQIASQDPNFSRFGSVHARIAVWFTYLGYRNWERAGALYFCVSKHAQSMLADAGVAEKNVVPVTWGPMVDQVLFHIDQPEAEIAETRQRLTFGIPGAYLLVYAGRVTAEKGIQFLVDALARGPSHVVLALIGPGSMTPELKKLHGKEHRLYCTGESVSREQVALAFRAADCGVSASVMETIGFTAMEALCCGTPMLAANASGFAEHLTHGVNARLWTPGSAESYDAELAAMMATEPKGSWTPQALRASMEASSVDVCTERCLSVYQAARKADKYWFRIVVTFLWMVLQAIVAIFIN